MSIVMGMSLNNPYVLIKYLGGIHSHLRRQAMLFKPIIVDDACIESQYLENVDRKKE